MLGDLTYAGFAIRERYRDWYASRMDATLVHALHARRDDLEIILERADAAQRNLDEALFVVEHFVHKYVCPCCSRRPAPAQERPAHHAQVSEPEPLPEPELQPTPPSVPEPAPRPAAAEGERLSATNRIQEQ